MSAKYTETLANQSTDVYSAPVDLERYGRYSVQITATDGSSYTGTVTLQVCNNQDAWSDVPATELTLSGTSDSQVYDVTETAASYARIKLVMTTGSADFRIDWVLKS